MRQRNAKHKKGPRQLGEAAGAIAAVLGGKGAEDIAATVEAI